MGNDVDRENESYPMCACHLCLLLLYSVLVLSVYVLSLSLSLCVCGRVCFVLFISLVASTSFPWLCCFMRGATHHDRLLFVASSCLGAHGLSD